MSGLGQGEEDFVGASYPVFLSQRRRDAKRRRLRRGTVSIPLAKAQRTQSSQREEKKKKKKKKVHPLFSSLASFAPWRPLRENL